MPNDDFFGLDTGISDNELDGYLGSSKKPPQSRPKPQARPVNRQARPQNGNPVRPVNVQNRPVNRSQSGNPQRSQNVNQPRKPNNINGQNLTERSGNINQSRKRNPSTVNLPQNNSRINTSNQNSRGTRQASSVDYEDQQVKYRRRQKRQTIILISLIAILVIYFVGTKVINRNKTNVTDGIEISGESYISGLTIMEIVNRPFEVLNRTKTDVSRDTIWMLNNSELDRGTNTVYLPSSRLKFGDNKLIAYNHEDVVEYTINIEKGISDSDSLHTTLSLLTDTDVSEVKDTSKYVIYPGNQFNDYASNSSKCLRRSDGYYETVQRYGNFTVSVVEKNPFSVALMNPGVELGFANVVEIGGSFENVASCEVRFYDNDIGLLDNFVPAVYRDNAIEPLSEESYYEYNSGYSFKITSPGVYAIVDSFFTTLEDKTVKNKYNIVSITITDNMYEGSDILNTVDSDDTVETETENTAISHTNNAIEESDLVTDIRNLITSDAMQLANNELQVVDIKVSDNYVLCNDNLIEANGNDIATTVGKFMSSGSPLTIIVDFNQCNLGYMQSIIDTLSQIAIGSDYKRVSVIALNSKVSNLESLQSDADNIKFYTPSNPEDINDYLFYINSGIGAQNVTISIEGKEVDAYKIADSGIKIGNHTYTGSCDFNSALDFGNWYGLILLTRLGYEGKFSPSMVFGSNVVNLEDDSLFNLDKLIQAGEINGVSVNSATTELINSGKFNEVDSSTINDISRILSLNIINDIRYGITDINCFCDERSSSASIDKLSDLINRYGPIPVCMESSYGCEVALVTSIYRSTENDTTYYIGLYDPLSPEDTQYAYYSLKHAISDSDDSIGWAGEFVYNTNYNASFYSLSLMNHISVFNDGLYYEVSIS